MSRGAAKPGRMRHYVRFEKPDDSGSRDRHGQLSGWAALGTVWAEMVPQRGDDAEIAARSQGRKRIILRVHKTATTSQINSAHRAVLLNRGSAVFEVLSTRETQGTGRRIEIELAAAVGETTGGAS
jgi:head-tail adaptor